MKHFAGFAVSIGFVLMNPLFWTGVGLVATGLHMMGVF